MLIQLNAKAALRTMIAFFLMQTISTVELTANELNCSALTRLKEYTNSLQLKVCLYQREVQDALEGLGEALDIEKKDLNIAKIKLKLSLLGLESDMIKTIVEQSEEIKMEAFNQVVDRDEAMVANVMLTEAKQVLKKIKQVIKTLKTAREPLEFFELEKKAEVQMQLAKAKLTVIKTEINVIKATIDVVEGWGFAYLLITLKEPSKAVLYINQQINKRQDSITALNNAQIKLY